MNETTLRPGDRVTIHGTSRGGRACFGNTGTINSFSTWGEYPYNVVVDGQMGSALFKSSALTKVPDEPSKSAAEIDAAVSELPLANRQAAQYAHDLLGDSADLDKLIGVAEFVMDRRTLGTETTGTVPIPPLKFATGGFIHTDVWDAAKVKPARPADRVLRDQDGDEINLSVVHKDWEVLVEVPGELGANLTGANLDAAIEFLTAARDYHRRA